MSKILGLKEWLTFDEVQRYFYSKTEEAFEPYELLAIILEHKVAMRFQTSYELTFYAPIAHKNFHPPVIVAANFEVFDDRCKVINGELIRCPVGEVFEVNPIENIVNLNQCICVDASSEHQSVALYYLTEDAAPYKYRPCTWFDILFAYEKSTFLFKRAQIDLLAKQLLSGDSEPVDEAHEVTTEDCQISQENYSDVIENPNERKAVARLIGNLILKAFPNHSKANGLLSHGLIEAVVREGDVTQKTAKKWIEAAADALKK